MSKAAICTLCRCPLPRRTKAGRPTDGAHLVVDGKRYCGDCFDRVVARQPREHRP